MATAVLGKILGAIPAVLQIIPLAVNLIHGVEELFRGQPKTGVQKKEAVKQAVSDVFNIYAQAAPVAGLTGAGSSEFQSDLDRWIDATVAMLNSGGVFVHSQT